jgi:hypothetical protein
LRCIQGIKRCNGQVHLTSDLEHSGNVWPAEPLRDHANGFDVGCDVLTDPTIAASGPLHQHTVLESHRECNAINFQFAHEPDLSVSGHLEPASNAIGPGS